MKRKLLMIMFVAIASVSAAFALPIGAADAERIALEHAGVGRADVRGLRTKNDRESGFPVYKVEFRTSEGEYEYEVLVSDGRLVSYDFEMDKAALAKPAASPAPVVKPSPAPANAAMPAGPATAAVAVTDRDEALRIALEAAGVAENAVSAKKVEFKNDKPVAYYDVEFSDSTYEWDFEIGLDGKVIEGEYELRRKGLPSIGAKAISSDSVEDIMSNLLGGPVTGLSIRSDYDDGRHIYKVHADKAGVSYEVELDAGTGTVYSVNWRNAVK